MHWPHKEHGIKAINHVDYDNPQILETLKKL